MISCILFQFMREQWLMTSALVKSINCPVIPGPLFDQVHIGFSGALIIMNTLAY